MRDLRGNQLVATATGQTGLQLPVVEPKAAHTALAGDGRVRFGARAELGAEFAK